jgi:membrane fusion protein
MGHTLFRSEIFARKPDRLVGDVNIAVPVAWQSIGYLLFGSVTVGALFLSLASYSRVVTVSGIIVPQAGVAQILPTRPGTIAALTVVEGQYVSAGEELVTIRSEEDGPQTISPAAQVETAIARQDASLSAQAAASEASAQAQLAQLAAQRTGLNAEIAQIESQMALQRDLIASAQKDLDRARSIADRGFISGRDLQVREETLLARQQGLSQLTQSLASKRASFSEAERRALQIAAQARAQSASLGAARAEVAQQATSAASSRAYVLRAPVAGVATALTARIGHPVNAQTPLMTIVPKGSDLQAQLAIPSSAIGFVKRGQDVRLAIDAFPYQRFGTVRGKVLAVAASAVAALGPNNSSISVYHVTIALDRASVAAYGRNERLVAGMTLTARIVTVKQTLLEWLFEPFFAVQRR